MIIAVAPLLLLCIFVYQGDDTPPPLVDAAMMASAPAPSTLPIPNPKTSSTDTTSTAPISTPTFRCFISPLSDSVRPSLANNHPWWELIDRPRPLPPFPSLPPPVVLLSATGSLALPPYEPHQAFLLAPILSKLGFQELAMAMPTMYLLVSSTWSGPLTLFAPSDDSLHSRPSCFPLRLLREHLIPGLLSLPYLSKLTLGTKLETANLGCCLTVTSFFASITHYPGLTANSSNIKIFINNVKVTHPTYSMMATS